MQCLQCGGPFEYAGAYKEFARCTRCLALHQVVRPGQVVLMDVRAPNGQIDPRFTAMYAQNLGFAPRDPTQHVVGMGGVNVVVPTAQIKREIANRISGMIWGWIITAIVVVVFGIGAVVFFFYIHHEVNAAASGQSSGPSGAPKTIVWDGSSGYTCGGNDNVLIKNTTANVASGPAIGAGGNCHLTLENVNVTAADGIVAGGNAQITIKGGSIKATDVAISALGNAQVTVEGAKVTGKTSSLGNAKIVGAK